MGNDNIYIKNKKIEMTRQSKLQRFTWQVGEAVLRASPKVFLKSTN